jgi:hypothetical protein
LKVGDFLNKHTLECYVHVFNNTRREKWCDF